MINLEQILEMWKTDAVIDDVCLDDARSEGHETS